MTYDRSNWLRGCCTFEKHTMKPFIVGLPEMTFKGHSRSSAMSSFVRYPGLSARDQTSRLHLCSHRSIASYSSRIAICAYTPPAFDAPVRGSPWEYSHDVWYGKARMVWLPDGEKNWRYDYSFWQNSRTWQTDGRTPYDSIGRACITSRGKKRVILWALSSHGTGM